MNKSSLLGAMCAGVFCISVSTAATAVPAFGLCGEPATYIHAAQGSGSTSPLDGSTGVIIEGVIVGDFEDTSTELRGFFLQEEDADADADSETSEGIFVFNNGFGAGVSSGDVVRVQGNVTEYFGLTELTNVTNLVVCSSGSSVTTATVTFPLDSAGELENFEGMLINIPQTLYVTDIYNLGRYGEVELSAGDRLDIPTNIVSPGAAAQDLADLNSRNRIQLDDGSTLQNPLPLPPYIGDGNTLRRGDTTHNLTGVLGFSFDSYELHPTGPVNFTRVNTRDASPPDVGGTLKIASLNVLNYFSTIDTGAAICGPSFNQDCRGADTPEEFTRQRDKLVNAILKLDADIVALVELENNATAAIQELVDGLNAVAGGGTYSFINSGTIGTDAIKVALIYQAANAMPIGPYAVLDASVDSTFIDTRNRPVLAQTFAGNPTGEKITIAVNHLKSKGSPCDDVGDPDLFDGQGNCNLTRTSATTALVNWLATDPTGSGDPDFLIIGDLNAYSKEDPISAIKGAGYTDLVDYYEGSGAYSYVFSGEAGYLDHALTNASLTPKVTGLSIWHINADEPNALNYNDFNQPNLYNPDPYRSSDHDPMLIGLFPDSDGDGVPDYNDNCSSEDATGFDVDNNGCIDSFGGLIDLVSSLVNEEVISAQMHNSLLSKISNAEGSIDRDNVCAAVNELDAFKNQVAAQTGKKISPEAASQVLEYADSVILSLQSLLPSGDTC